MIAPRSLPAAGWLAPGWLALFCSSALAAGTAPVAAPVPVPPAAAKRPAEVSVTAVRAERPVLDVPGNVTVIHRDEIERSGARDVPDLLRRQAGLNVTNTTSNPEGYRVEARGFNHLGALGSATLVLVDGRRVNAPDTTAPDWALLPDLDQIERIEVIRGPVSAVHGDNAQAGVIHLFTRRGEGAPRALLTARTGSFDTDGASLWAGGSARSWSADAYVDGFDSNAYRERAGFRSRAGRLRIERRFGEHLGLGVNAGYASQSRDQPGTLTPEQIEADRDQARDAAQAYADVRDRFVEADLAWEIDEQLRLALQSFHRRRHTESVDTAFGRFVLERQSDAWGVNSQLELTRELLGRRWRAVAGFDVLQEDADSDSRFDGVPLDPIRARRKLYGAFWQNELALREDWLLSFGARRDHARFRDDAPGASAVAASTGETTSAWGANAALTWRFSGAGSAYASFSRGFRFPNADEFRGFLGFFGEQLPVDPQKSKSWELGTKLRSGPLDLNLALYHMDVSDEIFFLPFPIVTTVNLERVRHRGVELSGGLRPFEWLELSGHYTYDDTEIRRSARGFEGSQLPITPEHRGGLGANALLPAGFEAGLHARWVGERVAGNDLANAAERLSHYTSWDARFAWRAELRRGWWLRLEAQGFNLADREYTEVRSLGTFGSGIGEFPAPGRHYRLQAQLELRAW